jgi:ABC-2 type transport system permease protein
MLSGMIQLVVQTVRILLVALLLGLKLPGGLTAAIGGRSAGRWLGVGFRRLRVAAALRSRSGRTAQAATFIFLPLLFLSDTFVPLSLIKAGWMRVAARINPSTYIFDAMRTLLAHGVVATPHVRGLAAIVARAVITLGFAVYTAQRTLREA